jgi:hypothetical protein
MDAYSGQSSEEEIIRLFKLRVQTPYVLSRNKDIVWHFVPLIVSLLKLIGNRSSKVSSPKSLVNVRKSHVRERQA